MSCQGNNFLEKNKRDKKCFLPHCLNSVASSPDKLFFKCPSGIQNYKLWLFSAGVTNKKKISPKTNMYFCQDHFDVIIICNLIINH